MKLEVSVPGSLLLAGEYFILLPGGLGLAAAPERRIRASATTRTSGGLAVRGSFAGRVSEWTETGGEPGIVPGVLRFLKKEFHPRPLPPLLVDIDSEALYGSSGNKTGLGSSAAVTVALVALVRAVAEEKLPQKDTLFQLCVEAHRFAQGGRGSGYDVAASLFGGVGIFMGGPVPQWEPLDFRELKGVRLQSGIRPVSSSGAVGSFDEERRKNARAFDDLRLRNDRLVSAFRRGGRFGDWIELLKEARGIGIEVGKLVGVNADLSLNPAAGFSEGEGFWKASGAGDELAFQPTAFLEAGVLPLSTEGLRRE
jgi:phosphomevalonate kinase